MANIKRGIKRIIWVLSVASSIAAWIILFSVTDLSPQKDVNNAGVAFIKWLDSHYFENKDVLTFEEFLFSKRFPGNFGKEIEQLATKIENKVKPDSVERWPFMWELRSESPKTVEAFDVYEYKVGIWKDRLRDALELNINEVKNAFPDIDTAGFLLRYGETEPGSKINIHKYTYPNSYFEVVYQRPYGRIIAIILLGIIPFSGIWILYFMVSWVIRGFQ
jgi:hypothetical protein